MRKDRKLYLYGGSFNPAGDHHEQVVHILQGMCGEHDLIVVIPCGMRPDKEITNDMNPIHRAAMVELTFGGMERVLIDFSDLEKEEFTRTWELEQRYQSLYPNAEIHHVIGTDLIKGGRDGNSEIHRWYRGPELMAKSKFIVFPREESFSKEDLPFCNKLMEVQIPGSSTAIRRAQMERLNIDDLVKGSVATYIRRWHLYTGRLTMGVTEFRPIGNAQIIMDAKRDRSKLLKEVVKHVYGPRKGAPIDHLIVIGGDGFMLDAIKAHHSRRLPFLGLNAGTLGHLLNNGGDEAIEHSLVRGTFRLYQSPLLHAQIEGDESVTKYHAFNELFLRTQTQRAAKMRVMVNGKVRFECLTGDGLMLATPAGSTGWSYGKGGTPIMMGTPQLVLTGDGTRNDRGARWVSTPLPNQAIAEIDVLEQEWRPVHLVVDGQLETTGPIKNITFRQSRTYAVDLAFFPETDLAEKITRLQFG